MDGTQQQIPQPQFPQQQFLQQQNPNEKAPPYRNNYPYAVPIPSLARNPAVVDCPRCGVREMTVMEYCSGGMTHALAALLCICACVGCIPYMIRGLKNVEHHCGNCGALLAVAKMGGGTEVVPYMSQPNAQ